MVTTAQELSAQLEQLLATGRRGRFLERAQPVLEAVPDAPQLALAMLQTLVEMGFGEPARELFDRRTDLPLAASEAESLRTSLAAVPSGRVPWSACAETFQRNFTKLCGSRPEWAGKEAWLYEQVAGLELYRSRQGHALLAGPRAEGAGRRWVADVSTVDDDQTKLPGRGQLGATLILGVRFGALIDRIAADTARLVHAFSFPLYVVEPDAARFAAWLHAADLTGLLGQERVFVLVGEGAVGRLGRLLMENERLTAPACVVNLGVAAGVAAEAQQTLRRVEAHRERVMESLIRRLADRYRGRDSAYWAERFGRQGPVLGVTSRFTTVLQYSMRDTLAALEARGYAPEMLIEAHDYEIVPPTEVCRKILEIDPLLMIQLDHLRRESPYLPANLPVVTWVQDPLPNLMNPEAGPSVGEFDFVCGYYRETCIEQYGYPAERFVYVPLPVSTRMFHDGPVAAGAAGRYAGDVCFVSNASTPLAESARSMAASYPAGWHGLLGEVYRRVGGLLAEDGFLSGAEEARPLVRAVAAEFGVGLTEEQVTQIATLYAYRLFDWGRRQQTLEWVADWARRTGRVLKLYGQGWERHPGLAEFAAGVLEHGEPLRQALRGAKLALQLIPAGFRHQRALEALAAGTLPLARYCPVDFEGRPIEQYVRERAEGRHPEGVATVFPGLERIVFRTPGEFAELAERYLGDESARAAVLGELRAVVLREYTYDAVMGRVLGGFREQLVRQAGDGVAVAAGAGR